MITQGEAALLSRLETLTRDLEMQAEKIQDMERIIMQGDTLALKQNAALRSENARMAEVVEYAEHFTDAMNDVPWNSAALQNVASDLKRAMRKYDAGGTSAPTLEDAVAMIDVNRFAAELDGEETMSILDSPDANKEEKAND